MKEQKRKLIEALDALKRRSAWEKGVKNFAIDLVDGLDADRAITKESLLNGAQNWKEYSYGGCAFIYDEDIAEALCNPTELKRTKHGERVPNASESWLDVQARALHQACTLVLRQARLVQ